MGASAMPSGAVSAPPCMPCLAYLPGCRAHLSVGFALVAASVDGYGARAEHVALAELPLCLPHRRGVHIALPPCVAHRLPLSSAPQGSAPCSATLRCASFAMGPAELAAGG